MAEKLLQQGLHVEAVTMLFAIRETRTLSIESERGSMVDAGAQSPSGRRQGSFSSRFGIEEVLQRASGALRKRFEAFEAYARRGSPALDLAHGGFGDLG